MPLTRTFKEAQQIFDDKQWGFDANSNATPWSARPGLFRCRLRRNNDSTKAIFEVRLQEGKEMDVNDKTIRAIVYPIHMKDGMRLTDPLGINGTFKYPIEAFESEVVLPIIVELKGEMDMRFTLELDQ